MSEDVVRHALGELPVPDEAGAAERAWDVVAAAFASRERVQWTRRHRGLVIAFAAATLVAAAVLVALLTPPGQAVVDRVRDAVGREPSEPALVRLPAPGRLLVVSEDGPWVVLEDGSKRLLGDYDDASWSPTGLYVVASEGRHLVALEPENGDVRWSLARDEPVRDPRWSGGGLDTRIAYRAGSTLHVVAGDGSPDAAVAQDVAPVAPAWKADTHVLAYAERNGRVHVVDVDARRQLERTRRLSGIRKLAFSPEGMLVVLTQRQARLYRGGTARGIGIRVDRAHSLLDAIVLRAGEVVYADYDPKADNTTIVLAHDFGRTTSVLLPPLEIFKGPREVESFSVSPNGQWLAAGWPEANQFLFFRLPHGRVAAVSNVTREFSPGTTDGAFPRIGGWAPGP
ncbi:MAG TPA: hypothetical protein VFW80_11915 [Gaiellaceae bacterium]|nr:hypothetical protein [Gaiellaceae bacterium]